MVEMEFMCLADAFLLRWFHKAKLKKMFVLHYPGFHLVGRSVGIFFFFNIYYMHMDGNGKKKKIADFEKKIFE